MASPSNVQKVSMMISHAGFCKKVRIVYHLFFREFHVLGDKDESIDSMKHGEYYNICHLLPIHMHIKLMRPK